jgi:hypothetical protein
VKLYSAEILDQWKMQSPKNAGSIMGKWLHQADQRVTDEISTVGQEQVEIIPLSGVQTLLMTIIQTSYRHQCTLRCG